MSLLPSILFFAPFSYAAVLNNTIVHEYSLSSSCSGSRSLWKIITSCATTLFACTWTAIHPNMPGPVEGGVAVALRHLGIMMLALVFPEAILMWAVRQFFAACVVQKRFQKTLQDGTLELRVKPCCQPRVVSANVPYDTDEVRVPIPEATKCWSPKLALCSLLAAMFCRPSPHVHEKPSPSPVSVKSLKGCCRWTFKHSFYAWMGGFMLYIDKDPTLPREIYHPLTPDELLEFLKADLVQMSMVSEKHLDDRSKGDWLSKTVAVMQLFWFIVQLAARAFGEHPTTQLEIASLATSILGCFTYAFWWYKPKSAHRPVPIYWKEPGELPKITYSVPFSIDDFLLQLGVKRNWITHHFGELCRPLLNLQGICSTSDAAVKACRVPSLCGYPTEVDKETFERNFPAMIIGCLLGMLFGSIHCIAWNFTFPTYIEQVLWRITSLGITVIPGLALVVVICTYLIADTKTIRHPGVIIYSLGMVYIIYCGFRFVLIVLMLISLRSLPVGVHNEVCWTSVILHWN